MSSTFNIAAKLHRIIKDSGLGLSGPKLTSHIFTSSYGEFSYIRRGALSYCSINTIRKYISFALEIDLLDKSFVCTEKSDVSDYDTFCKWTGFKIMTFNKKNGFDMKTLENIVKDLINNMTLPTTTRIYKSLNPNITYNTFRWALTLQCILKPSTLHICRSWLWLPKGTYSV